MSGFTRDSYHYGDRLVYEALGTRWRGHHGFCGCGDWLSHLPGAGLSVVREGSGFVAIVGPGLTEGVDEDALTTDVLWEAVTGKPGNGRIQKVRVIDRSEPTDPAPKPPYTWQTRDDVWCVRGRDLKPGHVVAVSDRHGRTTQQKILEIVHTTRQGWMLAHAEKLPD